MSNLQRFFHRLLFSNTVKKHCNINTSTISLVLSGVGALGLVCVFVWISIVSFHEMSKHPIEYPISVFLGIVCFFTFIVLIIIYLKLRKTNWSIKGIMRCGGVNDVSVSS